jgi:hypothetical protein
VEKKKRNKHTVKASEATFLRGTSLTICENERRRRARKNRKTHAHRRSRPGRRRRRGAGRNNLMNLWNGNKLERTATRRESKRRKKEKEQQEQTRRSKQAREEKKRLNLLLGEPLKGKGEEGTRRVGSDIWVTTYRGFLFALLAARFEGPGERIFCLSLPLPSTVSSV